MARTTVRFDDDIDDWIDKRLVQGQNRTVWLEYAIETGYSIDRMLDEIYEPYQYDKRQELIEAAVRKEVDRRKDEING